MLQRNAALAPVSSAPQATKSPKPQFTSLVSSMATSGIAKSAQAIESTVRLTR